MSGINSYTEVAMASATVGAFFADLTCEPGTSIKVSSVDCENDAVSSCDMRWNFTVSSASCNPGANMAFVLGGALGTSGSQRFGNIARTSCGGSSSSDETRLVMTTGYLDWDQSLNNTKQFQKATALICTPTYSIQDTLLQVGRNGTLINPTPSSGDGGDLANISPAQIADAVWAAASLTNLSTGRTAAGVVKSAALGSTNQLPFNQSDSFTGLIALARPDLDLSNAEDMETGIRQIFSTTAAQIAKNQLLTATNADVVGSTVQAEKRIYVREIPLRLMEATLAILILILIALVFLRPAPSTPRDLSSLGGLATVMAQSQNYVFALQRLGAATIRTIGQSIAIHEYQTCVSIAGTEPVFRIDVKDYGDLYERPRQETVPVKPSSWWSPISDLTRMAILAFNFALIVAIELLLQRSQHHDGLMNMSFTSSVPYAWAFIPALFAVMLWTAFGIFDFSIRLMQPYHKLRKAPVPARRSINVNYLSKVSVVTIFHAIVNRHFAVFFSAFGMLIIPFVTIISSGLYESVAGLQKLSTQVNLAKLPNLATQNVATGSQLPFVASLVTGGNLSWPQWTSDTLVFPELIVPAAPEASGNTTLEVQLPAMFATLNCTKVASQDIIIGQSNTTFPNINIPVNSGCGMPYLNSTGDYVSAPSSKPLAGAMYGRMFVTKTDPPPTGWSDNCPQISVVYGKPSTTIRSVDDLVVLNCYPAIMQTQVNTVFSIGTWSILGTPQINTSSTTRVANGDGATIDLNNIIISSAFSPAPSGTDFDTTFQALVGNRNPISISQLTASSMPDVVTSLNTLYARVLAQHLNLDLRSTTSGQTLPGNITTLTLRLHQNEITTRIIEALLAAMFLCLCISSILIDTREIMPNNPCSIAVMSSLIADSEFVKRDIVPNGSEWCNDSELRKRSVFEGYLFSLGMWDKKIPAVFGVDVGQSEKVE
jgi:hypothetical protein